MSKLVVPSLVVLDLDNTLYDYESANLAALTILTKNFAGLAGQYENEVKRALTDARSNVKLRLGETASSHSRILYISEAFRVLNLRPNPKLYIQLEEIFWETFLHKIELFPRVEEFLELIKVERIPLALVTDLTSTIQYRKLIKLGIDSYFDFILTSEEVGADKSSGIPFKTLTETFMQITDNSWFIGDSNFDRPITLGSSSYFFKKTKQKAALEVRDIIEFEDFEELIEYL